MSEKDNLPEADGTEEPKAPIEVSKASEFGTQNQDETTNSIEEETNTDGSAGANNDIINEIETANAEDAEDENNSKRHDIEEKDYHALSFDELVDEFSALIKNQNIQTIKSQVDLIKNEFNTKFDAFLEEKKEEFLAGGGNIIDFHFSSPVKKRFNDVYKEYRSKQQAYYKDLETNLKSNLQKRLSIIEEIKGLINVEENINTTYKHFKDLQEQWKTAGPIPRDRYNNVWNNYHHHVEIFYDFLHLNRDLRDLDFKHNLDQKLKIILRAEELAKDDNSNRAFRELQVLHKIWKEELGPVDKEYRDQIWERFSAATKTIHEKRQVFFQEQDKVYENNLVKKHEIISQIETLSEDNVNNHSAWQKKIKEIEALREAFFKAGKVPIKVNEETWAKFKTAVRNFNKKKNVFYKSLKKEQYNNLQKKLELITIAENNKDSVDFEVVTPLMKKIQNDWKKIGHVPRRDSDKIWKQFKGACNHYFDKLHESKNAANAEEIEALNKKEAFLENLKTLEFKEDVAESLEHIKELSNQWKAIGKVPYNKRFIDGKFNKAVDVLYTKLNLDKSETEALKYDNKLESLANDRSLLDNEHNFIRKKIDEIKGEVNQLENNLQFFSNVDEKNPLVKDVLNKIETHRNNINSWTEKLKKIKKFY
ncbi:DUF349 domain-containing protein [Flavobacteriaceae bacterium AU392]|nr:DUF349 domain-containing protein [Flavobacteriaceae bacterium]RKM83711.1 DUF349 domain-containing protein [Flavobacteriaceae bacterium AU392]